MPTRVRSHAKINLGLAIGPVRRDGYHALATIYQTLAIHDFVTVTAMPLAHGSAQIGSASQIEIACNDARVPCDTRNTCWKIVDLTLRRLNIAARVIIHIEKRLPVQGGLGAGSANAAAALIGLEKELGIDLPAEDKLRIAAETGSDVPLFLIGGTVLGLGRGEEVSPMPDLPQISCVLAIPDIAVSTPQAFSDWDRLHEKSGELTGDTASDRLKQLGRTWASALAGPQEKSAIASGVFPARAEKDRAGNLLLELVRTGIENDFETVVFTQYPSLRAILETLKNNSQSGMPATFAALSGSGSTLFGLYASNADSQAVVEKLARQGIQTFETKFLGRQEYWRNLASVEG